MRRDQIKTGQTLAYRRGKYGLFSEAVVLSDQPFILPSANHYAETRDVPRPEGVADLPGVPEKWTNRLPVPAKSWKESVGYSYSKRSAGVLVLQGNAARGLVVMVVPTRDLHGDYETVIAEERAERQREAERREARDAARSLLAIRANTARDAANAVLRDSEAPEVREWSISTDGEVRLSLAQFEALIAAAERGSAS